MFGIGDGTVVMYTIRVIVALIAIYKEAVQWHTRDDVRRMKIRLWSRESWRVWEDCVGLIDGSLFPFVSKPGYPPDIAADFFCRRKQSYGMVGTVICDDTYKILNFTCLFPGSVIMNVSGQPHYLGID